MRNFRSTFIAVLFLLVLLAAAVWALSENAASDRQDKLFADLRNTKIGLWSCFAPFLEQENDEVLQKLDELASKCAVEVEKLAKFKDGKITEESRKEIDTTLQEILPPYLEAIIFGHGKKPYALVSEHFVPVVPFLMRKSAEQKRGMLAVKFPVTGFVAYSCVERASLNTCVFLSTSLITQLIGDKFRKPARVKAITLLEKLSAESTLDGGMTYILGEKVFTDKGEFPDGLEEAVFITSNELRTFSHCFLKSVFYVKSDVPGMNNFQFLSYVVLIKPQMRFLLLLVIAFLLAPVFTVLLIGLTASSRPNTIDADVHNILLDILKRPYAVFTRGGSSYREAKNIAAKTMTAESPQSKECRSSSNQYGGIPQEARRTFSSPFLRANGPFAEGPTSVRTKLYLHP